MSTWQSHKASLSDGRPRFDATSRLDRLLVPFLGLTLLLRVLTDDVSAPNSRHSGSLNLSGGIAVAFIIVAIAVLLRRHRGARSAALAALWLFVWTAVAVNTRGASTETLREGVREGSVVALAVLVFNAADVVTVPVATRLVQFVGFAPAIIALYQVSTHTGMDVAGNIRSNGTFAQPNSAVMFFVLATVASLWRYLDVGRRRLDALMVMLFAAAAVATFSIDGLASLLATVVAFGILHRGSLRDRLIPFLVGALAVLAFFATPLGAQRVAKESSTDVASAERGEANSTLAWRLHKWETLLPEWERSPIVGRGLGTTTTVDGSSGNEFTGALPHNEYLRYLVETGVIGFAIVAYAVALLIRRLAGMRRSRGATELRGSSAATLGIAIVVGCLVNSLADNTFLNSPTCYAAALMVAAILGSTVVQTRRAADQRAA
jgi:O-antigen ligase